MSLSFKDAWAEQEVIQLAADRTSAIARMSTVVCVAGAQMELPGFRDHLARWVAGLALVSAAEERHRQPEGIGCYDILGVSAGEGVDGAAPLAEDGAAMRLWLEPAVPDLAAQNFDRSAFTRRSRRSGLRYRVAPPYPTGAIGAVTYQLGERTLRRALAHDRPDTASGDARPG